MNDLSKDLISQAVLFANETVACQWLGPEEPNPKWHEVRDSKLIELVLKKCLKDCWQSASTEEYIFRKFGIEYKYETTPLPKEDSGSIFEVKEWDEAVLSGAFIPDDGSGYWATKDGYVAISVWDTKPDWATHVVWFNK